MTCLNCHVLIMAFLIHDNLLMCDIWGFSYMTFGAILAKLVCNTGKAGIALPISMRLRL